MSESLNKDGAWCEAHSRLIHVILSDIALVTKPPNSSIHELLVSRLRNEIRRPPIHKNVTPAFEL